LALFKFDLEHYQETCTVQIKTNIIAEFAP